MCIKKKSKTERLQQIARSKTKQNIPYSEQSLMQDLQTLSLFHSCQIVCFVGINSIQTLKFTQTGHFKRKGFDDLSQRIDGRILSIHNDEQFNTGVLFLTDDRYIDRDQKEYTSAENNIFRVFPDETVTKESNLPALDQKNKQKDTVTLYNLKHGQIFKLLDDTTSDCIDSDTYFQVVKANRSLFAIEKIKKHKKYKHTDKASEDQIIKAFMNKKYAIAVVLYSQNK